MRYYYDDPLSAAWMAKHFGIKFITKAFENLNYYPEYSTVEDIMVNDANGCFSPLEGLIYIHPDSLHLLETKISDVIEFNYPYEDSKQVVMVVENSATVYEQGIELNHIDFKYKIIQRNGIPFHYPKSEEA